MSQITESDGWLSGDQAPSAGASPRLFGNPMLDKLSRVHHVVPLLLYLPVIAALLWSGFASLSVASVLLGLPIGYTAWTLVEYLGHRLLFHFVPVTSVGRRVQYLVHGVHHDHPADPLRLVMPPLMSLPIMAAGCAVLRMGGGATFSLPVMAGFLGGYLAYDMLHFHLHHGRPRTPIGRYLRYRHMHHHFRDESSWFGVSAPWWDRIFLTQPVTGRKA